MQLQVIDDLPFVSIRAIYQGAEIDITPVLIDTGSAETSLRIDALTQLGIEPRLDDEIHFIRGVGGRELVFVRQLDELQVGSQKLAPFVVQISGMDYGFEIEGILGMDFLRRSGAVIDLHRMQLEFVGQ